jgi:signal transduction histidine kinase
MEYIFRNNIKVLDDLHGIFSILIFFVVMYFIYMLWKMRTKLTAYILRGTIVLTIGTFITSIINILMLQGILANGEYYFYPLLMGIALEIYFFNSGLFFKTSSNEKELITTQQLLISELNENEKLLVEKQDMRNKIAQDLHDDIGATLSGIAMHSHLSTLKVGLGKSNEALTSLKLIENSAAEMVNKLNDIVWAVNPGHDEIGKMFQRLEEYAVTMAAAKNIEVISAIDAKVSKQKLGMEVRKNIFLIGKEAVNNAVKYSGASRLSLQVKCEDDRCLIIISDNGKGFDHDKIRKGNGLINMKRRAEEINMLFNVSSAEGNGTIVSVEYKNTAMGYV